MKSYGVMLEGLRGLTNHMQQRVNREIGLVKVPSAFWVAICKKLEIAAREMVESRVDVDEAGGRIDEALARFAQTVQIEVQGLGILNQQEERLSGMIYTVARAGLATLVPATVAHLETLKNKEAD